MEHLSGLHTPRGVTAHYAASSHLHLRDPGHLLGNDFLLSRTDGLLLLLLEIVLLSNDAFVSPSPVRRALSPEHFLFELRESRFQSFTDGRSFRRGRTLRLWGL